MKRLLLAASMLCATTLFAEGYQVNLQSTKQAGMAHTGTAMKLGAEAMHFNPAALVFMDKSVELSVGGSAVMTDVKFNDLRGYTAKTNNPVSTPFYIYAGFNIFKDVLAAGLSVTTPYGSSLDWGKNWKGATAVQDISLRSFVFQPTVSVQIIDGLSFGAGLMVATGSFELSRSMMSVDQLVSKNPAALEPIYGRFSGSQAASATLSGKSNVRVGYNLGLFYQVSESFSVGLNYRSKIKMRVEGGEAVMNYLNAQIEQTLTNPPFSNAFPQLNMGTFGAELPLPANTTLGLCFTPTDRWMVAFDLQYTAWKAYDKLSLQFTEEVIKDFRNITSLKNYKNTFAYRIGAQYKVTDRFNVRAGAYYDESPVRSNNYNPETPGADKLGVTAGFSFSPYQNLSIDFAFTYINGEKRNGVYVNPLDAKDIVAGEYKSEAIVPSFGVSYKF